MRPSRAKAELAAAVAAVEGSEEQRLVMVIQKSSGRSIKVRAAQLGVPQKVYMMRLAAADGIEIDARDLGGRT